MTSSTSRISLLRLAVILTPLTLMSLFSLGAVEAVAKKPKVNSALEAKKALQDQVDKRNAQPVKQDLYQTDYSKAFSYIMPPGWQVTQNPLYPHDILVRQSGEGKANIVLADKPAKGNLSKMSHEMVDDLPKQCDDFKLISNEMIKLPSGAKCARLMHAGKLGEREICQVNYLMPYTRGRILIVTGTVFKGDQDGLDTAEKFAFSITMKKKKLSL